MDNRYKRYNEITFAGYCKTSICNAIRKGALRSAIEQNGKSPFLKLRMMIFSMLAQT